MTPAHTLRQIAIACLLLVTLSVTSAAAPYEVTVQKDVMVPMRDGIRLATDIYLPTQDGKPIGEKIPTILDRRPYNKDGCRGYANYYVSRGYAFVAQDTRGRYKSEGIWHWMTDDGRDGADLAAWIGDQSWSDGKIGMIGTSYVGGTQHAMAMEKVPQLVTVIPVDAVSNCGYASMRNGGAFELRFWNWIMFTSPKGSRASRDPGTQAVIQEMSDNRRVYLQNLPLRYGTTPLKLAPECEEWLVEAMKHGANDEFWEQNNIIDFPERYKDMPVYLVGGWYDSWASNTTANFMTLSKTIKGPVYLIMGPWIHGAPTSLRPRPGRLRRRRRHQRPPRLATPVVRSLAQRHREQGRTRGPLRHARPDLHHGHRRRAQDRQRPTLPRRLLARRTPVAPRPHQLHRVLPPTWRQTLPEETRKRRTPRPTLSSTQPTPCPASGGNISSGNDIMVQGAWDQKGGDHIWNFTDPHPPLHPKRRRRLPDRTARGRHRSHRRNRRQALGVVLGRRHRLHRQAPRHLPAEPPISPAAST